MMDLITTPFAFADLAKLKEAGSTSVILATPFFSVRGAHVFPIEALPLLKAECERLTLRMYVLVNRLFTEEELPAVREHLLLLRELDVDGIYYGDEAVLYEARQLNLCDKLIYCPDTLITNHHDARYYIEEGVAMVTVAKEITLAEICEIAQAVGDRCEVVIHGRVNMMHSKRPLLTNYMRFLNREDDLRDNHTLYLMEENREEHMPIIEDEAGTHIFSGYTLASFVEIKALYAAGVRHFRVDGIFHDLSYVCEAISLYQAVLEGSKQGDEVFAEYAKKYAQDNVTHGFYYTKTSKVKEG